MFWIVLALDKTVDLSQASGTTFFFAFHYIPLAGLLPSYIDER
jgi:hypothetical protein